MNRGDESWYCKNNYNLQHSSIIWPVWLNGWVFVYKLSGCEFKSHCSHLIIITVSCFSKHSIVYVWQSSEYASGSKYLRVLSMSLVLNVSEFWIWIYLWFWMHQDTEYARVTQGSEFAWIITDYWLCLNMPDYVGICLNMLEYARICMNVPKSAWPAFVSLFPLVTLHYTWLLIWRPARD